jgi:hypothetical protein
VFISGGDSGGFWALCEIDAHWNAVALEFGLASRIASSALVVAFPLATEKRSAQLISRPPVGENLIQLVSREPLKLSESAVLSYQPFKDALHVGDVVVRPELDRERADGLDGEGQRFNQNVAVTTRYFF